MYFNKALILGNLTRDPEMKSLPSGVAVTTFSVATNRIWKDRDGARQEGTEFHNVVVFNRQAELCAQYLKKGQTVFVEGRLQTRSWDDAGSGQKRYRTEVVADRVQFGPRTGGVGSANAPDGLSRPGSPTPSQESKIDYPEEDINPEDIPF